MLPTLADRVKGSIMAPTPFPAALTSMVPCIHRDAAAPGPCHKMGAQDGNLTWLKCFTFVAKLNLYRTVESHRMFLVPEQACSPAI